MIVRRDVKLYYSYAQNVIVYNMCTVHRQIKIESSDKLFVI